MPHPVVGGHGTIMTKQASDSDMGSPIPSLLGFGDGLESRDRDGGHGHPV